MTPRKANTNIFKILENSLESEPLNSPNNTDSVLPNTGLVISDLHQDFRTDISKSIEDLVGSEGAQSFS